MNTLDRYYERGVEKGIEKGIRQGIEQGIEKGIEKGKEEVVLTLLSAERFTTSEIAKYAGVTEAFVEKIRSSAKS